MLIFFEYIEDITRLREDMDFMFEWQEQVNMLLTDTKKNAKFKKCFDGKSLSCRVMFFLLYGRFECS